MFKTISLLVILMLGAGAAMAADGGTWVVNKVSGEVWLTSNAAKPASLRMEDSLQAGDMIQTGRNGRVLLVRGEESMMISPNSVIGLPSASKDGMATTIVQRAGSALFDVEKKNVQHFEVETPFLAAVVKGTHFSVTVGADRTNVAVERGQVEVADLKTGQIAQIMPGQAASTFSHGRSGLMLSGPGVFSPIEHGKPRPSSVEAIHVPKGGLVMPQQVQRSAGTKQGAATNATKPAGSVSMMGVGRHGALRISAPIGETKLNFHAITKGLAHGAVPSVAAASRSNSSPGTGSRQRFSLERPTEWSIYIDLGQSERDKLERDKQLRQRRVWRRGQCTNRGYRAREQFGSSEPS